MTDVAYLAERRFDRTIANLLDETLGPGMGQRFLDEVRETRKEIEGEVGNSVRERADLATGGEV
jgi:hypothetical protein